MVGESLRDTISDSTSMLRQTMLEIHSEFVSTWRFFYIDRWLSFLACACHHPVATASFSMGPAFHHCISTIPTPPHTLPRSDLSDEHSSFDGKDFMLCFSRNTFFDHDFLCI